MARDSPTSLYVTTAYRSLCPKDANAWNKTNVLSLSPDRKPSLCPTCHSPAKCPCSHQADPSHTIPKCEQAGSAHPTEVIVLNREFAHHVPQRDLKRVDEQPAVSALDGSGCGKTFCCVGESFIYLTRSCSDPTIVGYFISPLNHWW